MFWLVFWLGPLWDPAPVRAVGAGIAKHISNPDDGLQCVLKKGGRWYNVPVMGLT